MRTFPKVYSQRDPKWANQRLGTVNGTTIGSDGCYVTSFAIAASYYQKDITPAKLDDWFTDGHVYYNQFGTHKDPANLCSDNMLQVVFGDIVYQKTYDYQNSPADLNKLKELLLDPTLTVILEVDFDHNPNDGIQTHFLVAGDCDGEKVKVVDPWWGSIDDFTKNYGDNPKQTILKFVVYKGNIPTLVEPTKPIEPVAVLPSSITPVEPVQTPQVDAPNVASPVSSTPAPQPTTPPGAQPVVNVVVTTDKPKVVTTTVSVPKKKHVDYFVEFLIALFTFWRGKK